MCCEQWKYDPTDKDEEIGKEFGNLLGADEDGGEGLSLGVSLGKTFPVTK
jgi:hypothetical protein